MEYSIRLGIKMEGDPFFADVRNTNNIAAEGFVRLEAPSISELGGEIKKAISRGDKNPGWTVHIDAETQVRLVEQEFILLDHLSILG